MSKGANITNNTESPLGVGSVNIAPGATVLVADWDVQKESHAVKVWLELGLISADTKAAKKVKDAGEGDGTGDGDGATDLPGVGLPGVDPDGGAPSMPGVEPAKTPAKGRKTK